MTKTLVISYTPRKGSYTKILVDEFLELANGKTEIDFLDLVASPPDLLLSENLNLIMEWNKGKRDFSNDELAILSNHQKLIQQILDADNIVLAFPIYNFSMPATVKAWIDSIVVSDKTFSFDPEKGFVGLCGSKKGVSIIVAGMDYNASNPVKEYASMTIKQNFDFIGIASECISAYGVDQNADRLDAILDNAKLKMKVLANKWYKEE